MVSAVAVAAEEWDWEVSEKGSVAVAAAAEVVALTDEEESVDMAEMVILEMVAQEGTVTDLALEVGPRDLEVVDTDMAVGDSVETTDHRARFVDPCLVRLQDRLEVVDSEVALPVA